MKLRIADWTTKELNMRQADSGFVDLLKRFEPETIMIIRRPNGDETIYKLVRED